MVVSGCFEVVLEEIVESRNGECCELMLGERESLGKSL